MKAPAWVKKLGVGLAIVAAFLIDRFFARRKGEKIGETKAETKAEESKLKDAAAKDDPSAADDYWKNR